MPIVRNCLAACAVLVCFTAQAQVLRCTDARTGQVTYTDGTCPGAASVREVEPRKTPQEIQLEREQAAQALARKQQQLQAERIKVPVIFFQGALDSVVVPSQTESMVEALRKRQLFVDASVKLKQPRQAALQRLGAGQHLCLPGEQIGGRECGQRRPCRHRPTGVQLDQFGRAFGRIAGEVQGHAPLP